MRPAELVWYLMKVMEHLGCNHIGLKGLAKRTPHAKPAGAGVSSIPALIGLGYTKINPAVNQRVINAMNTAAIKNFIPTYVDDVVMSTESSQGVAATNTAPSVSTSSPFLASSSSTVGSSYRSTPIKMKTPTKNNSKVAIKANRSSGRASRKMSPNRGNNRRGGGVNSPSRQSVLNNTSNRPPVIPVDLTGVFGSNPKQPPKPPTSFSFGAPHPKPTEESDAKDERGATPASSGFGFGGAPSPVNSQLTYTSEPSLVAEENALTRTNPFEELQLSDLSTNFTNLKVVGRLLNGDEISQQNPLSTTCLNMIEDPTEVEASFEEADRQLGRWVKNMAKESASAPVVKFMSAVGEEVNKRRELVSKEEEVRRAAQSQLNAISSQLSTAVRNSEMIRDNEISILQAEREAEIKMINAKYDGYVAEAKQDHDSFVTSVGTSASESENKCKGVIVSANDNIIQLKEDEKKDLTKVKAQAKVLKHSFRMFELYGQSVTTKKDSQGNYSTFDEADRMKEKLLNDFHPALASGDDDRMISDILNVD